ncbi:MAG: hypothetical protein R6V67_04480, partial [Spirochaetia bacterium]
ETIIPRTEDGIESTQESGSSESENTESAETDQDSGGDGDFPSLWGPKPLSRDEAVKRVLDEARVVISAMLYGFSVEYTPLDRERGMEERLVVEPLAQIEKGDPALRALDTRVEDGRFYVRIRYDLKDHQIRRRNSWKSNTNPSVTGEGSAPLSEGSRGKISSYEEAIKGGLRAYLRPREFNKPREIVGKVLFLDPPYTRLNAGGYHSKVRMKLRIDEVVPYGAY